ncbi:HNH endonuclease signature motif containing protein [Tersicoccus sp. Bi-70]|uniref:HNH endonuclease signature motif containing protein n=1 Tax=Tersicoccus sp. Bi-70 TaxID=1897634 RepID=UPI0009781131|nr:HNH endonuclease signature motif containing protein [Tersicoccus sp. Bi-70]OMH35119.1 hypothetical protein BGP79_02035 [Tersicoccus sp. Bi-70]
MAALEEVRRLESWLAWTKHRVIRSTMALAAAEHEHWVDAHPVDESLGLSRAERLAVRDRSAVAEIAGALHIGEDAAHRLVVRADVLTDHLPAADAALRAGLITGAAAGFIATEAAEYVEVRTGAVDPEQIAVIDRAIELTETVLLSHAVAGCRPESLKARARRLRDQCHPRSFHDRHEAAMADRYVRVTPDRDGMARLAALLPAAIAVGIDARLSALARTLQQVDGPRASDAVDVPPTASTTTTTRTLTQLRADVLADLMSEAGGLESNPGSPVTTAPASRLLLTMPATTLLGGDDPAVLGAFGPIGAADARRLAAAATCFLLGVTTHASAPDHPDDAPPMATSCDPTASSPPGSPAWSVPPTVPGQPASSGPPGTSHAPATSAPPAPADTTGTSDRPTPSCPPAHAAFRAGPLPPTPPERAITGEVAVIPVVLTDGQLYRIPDRLRRALAVRDGTCRFPGCRRSAETCDIDHVVPWADGGLSEPANLAHLCRRHHVLKHHSAWSVTAETSPTESPGADRLIWTSPTGRRLLTTPEPPPF